MELWYKKKANEWLEALPLGNGHLGAMCYGGNEGKFDLSENTCWSGARQELSIQENGKKKMEIGREYLLHGKIREAEEALNSCCGIKGNYGTQLPLGRMFIEVTEECEQNERKLNLTEGITTDILRYDHLEIKRESFISNPAKLMCTKLNAQGEVMPQLRVWLEGYSNPSKTESAKDKLIVSGLALENIHSDGRSGVAYRMELKILTDGEKSFDRFGMQITNATYLYTFLAAKTDFVSNEIEQQCGLLLKKVTLQSYEILKEEHVKEHSGWMNRCQLNLERNENSELPTDERIHRYKENDTDYDLCALFFQYGRYLILSSSRSDSILPAALQGIWNDNRACRMEWTDDMHLDINTQMNYMCTENTGLSECNLPLFRWIKNQLMPNGRKVAKELYDCDGWVAHTVSNAFGYAAPGWGGCSWAFFVAGGGWICTHIWEHYLYTKDTVFLKEYYDVLYGQARFLFQLLMEDPKTKDFVTVPSYSPENGFIYEKSVYTLTRGATLDISITKYIFKAVLEASTILNLTDPFCMELNNAIDKLPEFKIGKNGQLQEWYEDYEEAYPDHRHTSHLLSMFPLNLINPEETPVLKEAVCKSIERRLGKNAGDIVLTNWAGALLIAYYARLLDGEKCGFYIKPMIRALSHENLFITHDGAKNSVTEGIYELDGNTGLTAALTEMLMQSYSGVIHVLPAIPKEWKTGKYEGLIAYAGHSVSAEWDEEQVKVQITASCDGIIKLKCSEKEEGFHAIKGRKYTFTFDKLLH